jgi:hypothetical protein
LGAALFEIGAALLAVTRSRHRHEVGHHRRTRLSLRVPYGTLLCVSDKPLHGESKLPGQANLFYERAISEHMRIGIEACHELRLEGPKLHSRKLRAFNEPPAEWGLSTPRLRRPALISGRTAVRAATYRTKYDLRDTSTQCKVTFRSLDELPPLWWNRA